MRGASGTGKSSLVLQLLHAFGDRAILVGDDRIALSRDGDRLLASVPDALAGLLEVRGLGIVRLPHVSPAAIDLVADIAAVNAAPRLPEADERRAILAGVSLPRLFMAPSAPDGAARVALALRVFKDPKLVLTI